MKSWAGKALETVNCCAFLKRSSWSMLTANLKLRAKKFFLFFLSLQYFTLKLNDSYSRSKYLRAPFAENKHVQLSPN
jgi:hypothetical protein